MSTAAMAREMVKDSWFSNLRRNSWKVASENDKAAVFIHDPLYKWALSPLKALQRQMELDDDVETTFEDTQDEYKGNKDAARALMHVKQKLDGYKEGELRSINGQQLNTELVVNMVQQQFKKNMHETDPDKIQQMTDGAARGLINHIIYEAEKMSGHKFSAGSAARGQIWTRSRHKR